MLSPTELRAKLLRRYPDVQRAWLTGENVFPLRVPLGTLPTARAELQTAVIALETDCKRAGYRIERQRHHSKTFGTQDFPKAVQIDTLDVYLTIMDKTAEFALFQTDTTTIRATFPALERWLLKHPDQVVAHHQQWANLLEICAYFVEHPQPNLFIRELPITPHTKFIEQNKGIVRSLLNDLLTGKLDPHESRFSLRFGLREDESVVRIRLLNHQLERQFGLALTDLSIPVSQLNALDLSADTGIIVENKTTFLTLPEFADTFAIFGSGFDVSTLKEVGWLSRTHLLYWGDLDVQGFDILAILRQFAPSTESIMMDRMTFDMYQMFAVPGTPSIPTRWAEFTEDEWELCQWLAHNNMRLEQEKLPAQYTSSRLKAALSNGIDAH